MFGLIQMYLTYGWFPAIVYLHTLVLNKKSIVIVL